LLAIVSLYIEFRTLAKILIMSNCFHILYSFFIVSLVVCVVISLHNNHILESRLNTFTKGLDLKSSEKTFKEDFYLSQLGRDTNLILVFIPLFVGIVSLFTYTSVIGKFRVETDKYNDKIEKQKSEWNTVKRHLSEFKSEYNFNKHSYYKSKAFNYAFEGQYDYFVFNFLESIFYLSEYNQFFIEKDDKDFSDFIKNQIQAELKDLNTQLNKLKEKVELSSKIEMDKTFSALRGLYYTEFDDLLYEIRSKFIFT
jgi:hypothetical protein